MRIVIRKSQKTGGGNGGFQDAVVYRLGQKEGVQLTLLKEGDHVTVRIQGGLAEPTPATRERRTGARVAAGSERNGQVRRARISGR